MSHYWTSDDHPAIRQAQIEDWITDLIEFPIGVVEIVCQDWRRTQTRRPTPADLRALAVAEDDRRSAHLRHLQTSEEGQKEIRARCAELYQAGGCEERFAKMGCVCFESCKAPPWYVRLSDEMEKS